MKKSQKSQITKDFERKSALRSFADGGSADKGIFARLRGRSRQIDQAVDDAVGKPPPAPAPAPAPPPKPSKPKEFRFADGGGFFSELRSKLAGRGKQIDQAVEDAVGKPPAPAPAPAPAPPPKPSKPKEFRFADGGDRALRGAVHEGPGRVEGPGGPREDKVNAKFSDGEYVLPAKTVDALGGPAAVDELVRSTNDGREPGPKVDEKGLRRAAVGGGVEPPIEPRKPLIDRAAGAVKSTVTNTANEVLGEGRVKAMTDAGQRAGTAVANAGRATKNFVTSKLPSQAAATASGQAAGEATRAAVGEGIETGRKAAQATRASFNEGMQTGRDAAARGRAKAAAWAKDARTAAQNATPQSVGSAAGRTVGSVKRGAQRSAKATVDATRAAGDAFRAGAAATPESVSAKAAQGAGEAAQKLKAGARPGPASPTNLGSGPARPGAAGAAPPPAADAADAAARREYFKQRAEKLGIGSKYQAPPAGAAGAPPAGGAAPAGAAAPAQPAAAGGKVKPKWYEPSKGVKAVGKLAGGLAKAAAPVALGAQAIETYNTPTAEYEKRGVNQALGLRGGNSFGEDLAVRGLGTAQDMVTAIPRAIGDFFGIGGEQPPAAPTAAQPAAIAAPSAAYDQSPAETNRLRAAGSAGMQTSTPVAPAEQALRRPPPPNGAGFDGNLANERQARANAIRGEIRGLREQEMDRGAMFQNLDPGGAQTVGAGDVTTMEQDLRTRANEQGRTMDFNRMLSDASSGRGSGRDRRAAAQMIRNQTEEITSAGRNDAALSMNTANNQRAARGQDLDYDATLRGQGVSRENNIRSSEAQRYGSELGYDANVYGSDVSRANNLSTTKATVQSKMIESWDKQRSDAAKAKDGRYTQFLEGVENHFLMPGGKDGAMIPDKAKSQRFTDYVRSSGIGFDQLGNGEMLSKALKDFAANEARNAAQGGLNPQTSNTWTPATAEDPGANATTSRKMSANDVLNNGLSPLDYAWGRAVPLTNPEAVVDRRGRAMPTAHIENLPDNLDHIDNLLRNRGR